MKTHFFVWLFTWLLSAITDFCTFNFTDVGRPRNHIFDR